MKDILYKNGLSYAIVQSLQDIGKKSLIQTWVNDVKDNSASSSPDKKKGLVTGILIVLILMITYLIIYFIWYIYIVKNKKRSQIEISDEDEDVSSNNEVTLYTSHLIIQVLLNI